MQDNQMAMISLIAGIFSVLTCLFCGPISLITGIVAIITGFMGIKNANAGNGEGKGMAIGGIVLGGFYFIGMIIAVIFLFAFGGLSMIMSAVG